MRILRQVRTVREVLPQKAVRIFVRTALPRTLWIAEIHLYLCRDGKALVGSKLWSTVQRHRSTKRAGESANLPGHGLRNGRRVFASELYEQRKAGLALDECCDMRISGTAEEVALPVARHGPGGQLKMYRTWAVESVPARA